ncbi:elongation factor P maturation arginine rhamnosyltransferase EarP [Sphaerotilus sp.]|uniref:elongation factor P maturation arginine rhamnosyltransferase EarP n=1 Tax=Sphaerotilus sp. TaxID=2093942 RepID=UPI0025CFB3A1|nr:elongation factor P maturation arginine rhamnosyltransferase EarP [Sphaerotilus sp.]
MTTDPAPALPPVLTIPPALRRWDVFCRVIDNHGDLGVCWRLARDLAGRGARVRLWVDDAAALAWMAPDGSPGVQVLPWRDPLADEMPADVVIEAFGCDPPAAYVARMADAAKTGPAPLWINLEYLSAEPHVESLHGLASPQWSGPGSGLTKWFFFPGFTAATGGLLREPGLLARLDAHDRQATRASFGVGPNEDKDEDEALMLLFGYTQPLLNDWLTLLAEAPTPTTLLVTPGYSARQVRAWQAQHAGAPDTVGALRLHFLPHVTQLEFDRLLWASDLNLVRGEDSLVRALWAGQPMLWQLYPQADGVHGDKLDAFLDVALDQTAPTLADPLRRMARLWNGLDDPAGLASAWSALWPARRGAWADSAATRQRRWAGQPDLTSSLIAWAQQRHRDGLG